MPNKPHLPPDQYRGIRTNVRWTEPEYIALSNLAKKEGLDVPKFIRQCVKQWAEMKKNERKIQKKGTLGDIV
jgi:hypothetical protein